MGDIIIKEIGKEDLPRCAAIVVSAFNAIAADYGLRPDQDTARLLVRLEDDLLLKARMLGAFLDDVQVGFVEIDSKDEEVFEITLLTVGPPYQGRGYGQALLDAATGIIRREGGAGIVCAVIRDNRRLRRWLTRNGFAEEVSGSPGGVPCAVCLLQKDVAD